MSEHDDNPRGLRSVGRRLLSVFSRSDARKHAETPPNDPDELRCEETDGEADVVVNAAVLRNESESEDATGKGTDSQEHESTPNATIEPRGAAPNVWLTLWEKVVPYDGWDRLEDKEALAEEASSHRAVRFAAAFIDAGAFTKIQLRILRKVLANTRQMREENLPMKSSVESIKRVV